MSSWLRVVVRLMRGGEVRRRRPNPLLLLYRWRWEVLLVAGAAGLGYLGRITHWAVPLGVLATGALVAAVWPAAWGAVRDRCWSVIVQHRLRTAFYELGLTTWSGRAPAIVWTSVRRGLRVHLLCPAGIGASELAEVREQLAGSCFAADVLVERDPRYANVVVLVIVNRVPASGGAASTAP